MRKQKKKEVEVTRVIKATITVIEKVDEDELDDLRDENDVAEFLKKKIRADHVEVTKMKDFIMDVKE